MRSYCGPAKLETGLTFCWMTMLSTLKPSALSPPLHRRTGLNQMNEQAAFLNAALVPQYTSNKVLVRLLNSISNTLPPFFSEIKIRGLCHSNRPGVWRCKSKELLFQALFLTFFTELLVSLLLCTPKYNTMNASEEKSVHPYPHSSSVRLCRQCDTGRGYDDILYSSVAVWNFTVDTRYKLICSKPWML